MRDHRDIYMEERLDEQQHIIRELETSLAEVAQHAAYIPNHIGGIPQRAFTARTGTCYHCYHLESTCTALQQSHDVKEWLVCCFLGWNRMIPYLNVLVAFVQKETFVWCRAPPVLVLCHKPGIYFHRAWHLVRTRPK